MNLDLSTLAATDEDVARMTRPEREARVALLIEESHALLAEGKRLFVEEEGKVLAATVVLFSGGNDSTVLAHLFREHATHAGHANTGVGVERTRQYVRDVCASWGLPLLERSAPRAVDSYRAIVLDQGFPGPGHHYKMFQRLKERALRTIRAELVGPGRTRSHRVIFLAGRRRAESQRRTNIPEFERDGSVVWISPLVNWTKPDMTTYRIMMRREGVAVPVNEVSDLIHMSGECLCGAFAHENERAEISMWFPEAFAEIALLEAEIADRDDIPDYRKTWGWGWEKHEIMKRLKQQAKTPGLQVDDVMALLEADMTPSTSGPLCSSCDARAEGGEAISVQ